ncbi:tyrosine-type recombinase/integrase [Alicyclobacillus mengziensis]|uniref:Site-specific integrase n=1 Tax=Alicyclobacillus mengziensis TaxID=2931921 RepID=A0A9X7Z8T9_9BACL|nr:site-specific integrase [Alicyclobacillus mengziensis]QSO48601.1 site-specific integrase [Alicyclobacillus mengziensis]QSO48668.1 site-specific integrase [Alicyclobacillus mengziensis]
MDEQKQVLRRLAEDIRLRGLSSNTLESYTTHARIFLEFSGDRPIEQLNAEDIRRFLLHLIHEKKVSPGTVNVYSAAIRFLFAVTLNRTLNYLQIPRQKKRKTLPEVLTRSEVHSILEGCQNIKHKAMLTVVYSSGLRVSEAAALKIQHIDSKNMRLFVQNGKGGKDRYTLLSDACLNVLREYWKEYRPRHPEGWLFLGTYNVTHITSAAIEDAFSKAVQRAHITKQASVHTLRHSFATHLLEDGATLLQIKSLLGHASVQSTTIYLHLANMPSGIVSPLDNHSTDARFEVPSHA